MIRFVMHAVFAALLVSTALVATLAAPSAVGPAASQESSGDLVDIQEVIAAQIAAFRAGDSRLAYSFASPGIRRVFPSPGIFMQMVERGYEPVFRPRSFSFIDSRMAGMNEAVQLVDIIGPDGASWIATYTLRRQPDGTWKITGCRLKPGVGT